MGKLALIFIPVVLLLSSVKIMGITSEVVPKPTTFPTPIPTETPTITPSPLPTLTPTTTPRPTNTPTPTITPIIITSEQLDSWFSFYSNEFSVERERLWSIAVCESKLNPSAKNGDYAGLFQFAKNTWLSTRSLMNLDPDPNLRFNPEEAIKTAAFKISTGGLAAWKNCVK